MSRVRLRCGAAIVGVVGVMGIVGCTQDPAPTPTTSASTTTSASSTTTSAPPATTSAPADGMPAAAKEKSKAGAEAFAKFFIQELNRSWTEPDSSVLSPLCDRASKACAAFQRTARDLEAEERKYRSDPFTARSYEALPADGGYKVGVPGTQNKVDVVAADGSVVMTDPLQSTTLVLNLVWEGGKWSVKEVQVGGAQS